MLKLVALWIALLILPLTERERYLDFRTYLIITKYSDAKAADNPALFRHPNM